MAQVAACTNDVLLEAFFFFNNWNKLLSKYLYKNTESLLHIWKYWESLEVVLALHSILFLEGKSF